MKLLLIILYLNSSDTLKPLPRNVMEWCLECDATNKVLEKKYDTLESININLELRLTTREDKINSYKRDSTNVANERIKQDSINIINNSVIKTQKSKINKISTNRWLERGIFSAIIVGVIILLKE